MATVTKSEEAIESAKVRLTLDLSRKLNAIVDEIAAEDDSTKAEVLRSAIEFLEAAKQAKKDGMRVGAWGLSPDGNREERVFIGV